MNTFFMKERVGEMPDRIKTLLKDRHISRNNMAKILEIDAGNYYRMLNGKRGLSPEILVLHCYYLNVSPSYLLVGDESLTAMPAEDIEDQEKIIMLTDQIIRVINKAAENQKAKIAIEAISIISSATTRN